MTALDGLSLLLAARTDAAVARARWLEAELRAALARAARAQAGAS